MRIKKNTLYATGTILLIVIGTIFLTLNFSKVTSQVINNNQEVQVIKLSVKNGQYILGPSQIKKDIPARIEADVSQMPGCSKSIVIPTFGVSKTFSSKDNKVEFIPDKAGTFNIACSMNMYKGKFTVLESDGTKSNYIENTPSGRNTCGAGGGCGCG